MLKREEWLALPPKVYSHPYVHVAGRLPILICLLIVFDRC